MVACEHNNPADTQRTQLLYRKGGILPQFAGNRNGSQKLPSASNIHHLVWQSGDIHSMLLHEPFCTAEDFFSIRDHTGATARRF